MKRYTQYILLLAAIIFAACSSSPDGVEPQEPASINFGADINQTRSTLIHSVGELAATTKPFRVFAAHTATDVTAPGIGVTGVELTDVFTNVDVKYDGRLTGWNYDGEPKMWESSGYYIFRGYWPSTTKLASATATTKSLVLEYSVKSNNDDLMVGYYACKTRNPDSYNNVQYVGFRFYHALAGVRVAVKIGSNAQASYQVKNVYFTSLIYNNSLAYTQTVNGPVNISSWGDAGVRSENDEFGVDRIREWKANDEGVDGHVPPTIDDENPQYLHLPWQLMIPQSLLVSGTTPKPAVVIEIETVLHGIKHTSIKSLDLPTPAGLESWLPGKLYTYTISLQPNNFNITVQSVDWDVVDGVAPDLEF